MFDCSQERTWTKRTPSMPACWGEQSNSSLQDKEDLKRTLRWSDKRDCSEIPTLWIRMGLKVLKRGGRKRAVGDRKVENVITKPNQCWALDFVHDSLANGKAIRLLTVQDVCTKECLKIKVNTSLGGQSVLEALEEIIEERGHLEMILSDNGTEFTSNAT